MRTFVENSLSILYGRPARDAIHLAFASVYAPNWTSTIGVSH
jgi:hypothetical protein